MACSPVLGLLQGGDERRARGPAALRLLGQRPPHDRPLHVGEHRQVGLAMQVARHQGGAVAREGPPPAPQLAMRARQGILVGVARRAARPTPHAASRRALKRFARRQPAPTTRLTPAACPRTEPQALPASPRTQPQAWAAAPSPAWTPAHARRSSPLGGSGGVSGGGAARGMPRTAASRSALVRTSVKTACTASWTAWPTASFTARSTAPSTADATAPLSASAKPSKMESNLSNCEASVRRAWPFSSIVVVMTGTPRKGFVLREGRDGPRPGRSR